MSVPKKKAVVSKKITDEQIKNSERWEAFVTASGTPFLSLSDEWSAFFDAQSNIETASTELVWLIDLAIEEDERK